MFHLDTTRVKSEQKKTNCLEYKIYFVLTDNIIRLCHFIVTIFLQRTDVDAVFLRISQQLRTRKTELAARLAMSRSQHRHLHPNQVHRDRPWRETHAWPYHAERLTQIATWPASLTRIDSKV